MSMDTVINTGHNRGTEPSNAGGHGLGEDKVAIKTDWGTVQPRKTEKKPQEMRETWVRCLFQTQCPHFIRKLCHSPSSISFCLAHTKPARQPLHPLHQTEREVSSSECQAHVQGQYNVIPEFLIWFNITWNCISLNTLLQTKTFCSEQTTVSQFQWCIVGSLKGTVYPGMKMTPLFTHPYVVSDFCAVINLEHKIWDFD